MSSSFDAVTAALSAVEERRAAQRLAEEAELEDARSGSEDESDEEEDEYGEELTPAMDAAILRTLRMIRKGEGVYGDEKVIEQALKDTSILADSLKLNLPRAQASKKFTLLDHQRQALLASNGQDQDPDAPMDLPSTLIPLTHVQEERALRAEVTKAFHTAIPGARSGPDEEDQEEDDFLVTKDKIVVDDEQARKYREFLLEQAGGEEGVREILGMGSFPERMIDADADVDEGDEGVKGEDDGVNVEDGEEEKKKKVRTKDDDEEFLMNYILNRGWIDTDDPAATGSTSEKPKKRAIVKPEQSGVDEDQPWGTLDDEDDFDDKAEEFENTYNFRFEEPGAANIVTHARNITSTARRTDDARKTARQIKAERKAEQAAIRAEQMRQEKGKKRREIEKRMDMLRKELGDRAYSQLEAEMEGDWDEEVFDRAMDRILAGDIGDDEDEQDDKPTWDDDIDTGYAEEEEGEEGDKMDYGAEESYPAAEDEAYAPGGEEDAEMEDVEEPLNMDADFISLDDASSKRKQRKEKKNKKKDKGKGKERVEDVVVDDQEGLSVTEQKQKVKQALEDYKKLDYEDMIGDLPTRFKYEKAAPQDYGLTPAEILLATDAELNQFLGMKHYAPYRHGSGVGAAGRGMRDRLKELKAKLATRKWGEVPEDDEPSGSRPRDQGWSSKSGEKSSSSGPAKKRKGKKERQRQAAAGVEGEAPVASGSKRKGTDEVPAEGSSKRQRV